MFSGEYIAGAAFRCVFSVTHIGQLQSGSNAIENIISSAANYTGSISRLSVCLAQG